MFRSTRSPTLAPRPRQHLCHSPTGARQRTTTASRWSLRAASVPPMRSSPSYSGCVIPTLAHLYSSAHTFCDSLIGPSLRAGRWCLTKGLRRSRLWRRRPPPRPIQRNPMPRHPMTRHRIVLHRQIRKRRHRLSSVRLRSVFAYTCMACLYSGYVIMCRTDTAQTIARSCVRRRRSAKAGSVRSGVGVPPDPLQYTGMC